MSDSEIFNNYAKIAIERGLISNDIEKQSKKNDKPLYNLKPENQYNDNIMEYAHPDPVIVGNSYDKINSLVENNIERQKIILNIVNRQSRGQLTNKKYAESELMHSLIRIGNDMDNRDIDPLRILADECADQLKKQADDWFGSLKNWFKEKGSDVTDVGSGAASGATIGGIAGGLFGLFGGGAGIMAGAWAGSKAGALIGGLISSISKTSPQAKNVIINCEYAKKELQDLIGKLPEDRSLKKLDEELQKTIIIAKQYTDIVDKLALNPTQGDSNQAQEIGKNYINQLNLMKKMIALFMQSAHSGKFESTHGEFLDKIMSTVTSVFGSDLHDEEGALKSLEIVIDKTLEDLKKVMNMAVDVKDKVESAAATQTQNINQPKIENVNQQNFEAAKKEQERLKNLKQKYPNIDEDTLKDIMKEMNNPM